MFGSRAVRILVCGLLIAAVALMAWPERGSAQSESTYVGTESCRKCHKDEYSRFKGYSKKARSFEGVKLMKKGLTDTEYRQCLECHTTGYGKLGGFRSEEETPHLKDTGCESCHGPGSLHTETGDPKQIKRHVTIKECETCHNAERVEAFSYKPMTFGGAH